MNNFLQTSIVNLAKDLTSRVNEVKTDIESNKIQKICFSIATFIFEDSCDLNLKSELFDKICKQLEYKFLPGSIFAYTTISDYKMIRDLGKGTHGSVCQVLLEYQNIKKECALKIFKHYDDCIRELTILQQLETSIFVPKIFAIYPKKIFMS
jgi:hypothetical protein